VNLVRIAVLLFAIVLGFYATGDASESRAQAGGSSVTEQSEPGVKDIWHSWVQQNGVAIGSFSDAEFSDLAFLENVIEDRRLVQLGESSHGVAEFNRIKVRLIKFLHEEMGFDVIAFESGLFECYETDARYADLSPSKMIQTVFRVWRTEEVLELFEYLVETKATDSPLTLAGFDLQLSGDWTRRHDLLRDMVSIYDPAFAQELFIADSLFAVNKKELDVPTMRTYVRDNEEDLKRIYTRLESILRDNMADLSLRFGEEPLLTKLMQRAAVSMVTYIEFWLDQEREMNIRDKAMAANVEFLMNEAYPNKKIIIWTHNTHLRHRNHLVKESYDGNLRSMGTWLHDEYADEMYTIGLYMFEGRAAYNDREHYDVESHAPGSLEAILHAAGHAYTFVDLKHPTITPANDWMSSNIVSKSWGLMDMTLVPRQQYDGLIQVETTTPPVYLE